MLIDGTVSYVSGDRAKEGVFQLWDIFDNIDVYKRQCQGCLKDILSNPAVFGVNLYDAGLGEKVEFMFAELAAGPGAVRTALVKYLG